MFIDDYYSGLIKSILNYGSEIKGRNGKVITSNNPLVACFTETPLVSLRKTAWKTALQEMEWFLSGSDNIHTASKGVQKWWRPWANEKGDVRYSYGKQLRGFSNHVDQVARTIYSLSNDPYSRRHVITTWNPVEMPMAPIANCHGTVIQFFATDTGYLNMSMYQRSADMIIGVPHNWIQYWAFLLWMASKTNMIPGAFYWIGGSCHIYEKHLRTAQVIADMCSDGIPYIELKYEDSNFDFKASNFSLSDKYDPVLTESLEPII